MNAAAIPALPANYRFLGVTALVFLASAVTTVAWCGSMSGMGGMSMPGGWTMSMAWMRMPGQTWTGATTSFLGMWLVMMVAMMLPALTPQLLWQRRAFAQAKLAGGYFLVWLLAGALLFASGVMLAETAMASPVFSRAMPLLGALAVLFAGVLQMSSWKARRLACCRGETCCVRVPRSAAWRRGLRAGVECCYCCLPLTLALVVLGVMDLAVMGLVTLAITAERLAPRGAQVARATGVGLLVYGALLLSRAWPVA